MVAHLAAPQRASDLLGCAVNVERQVERLGRVPARRQADAHIHLFAQGGLEAGIDVVVGRGERAGQAPPDVQLAPVPDIGQARVVCREEADLGLEHVGFGRIERALVEFPPAAQLRYSVPFR